MLDKLSKISSVKKLQMLLRALLGKFIRWVWGKNKYMKLGIMSLETREIIINLLEIN